MKKFLTFMTTCLIAGGIAITSSAAGKITESPDIKIAIDGKIGQYTDVPILQDGRTLLPLRAVLENLGVQNDDEHIIWEPKDKSITINKDSKRIFLQVGNKKAEVDESSFELDVPPMIYKNRTYIPARFVAESLGKKVVWDGKTKSVLIKDPASFDEVKEILTKSEEAMKNVKKAKMNMKMDMKESMKESASVSVGGEIKMEMDITNKLAHMVMDMKALGLSVTMEYYYDNDKQYMKGFLIDNWVKTTSKENDFDSVVDNQFELIAADDVGSAGLVKGESDNPDEIVLQGAAFFGSISNFGNSLMGEDSVTDSGDVPADYSVKIILDSKTYLLKNCTMEFHSRQEGNTGDGLVESGNISLTLTDVNGDFTVKIPNEVIKNAKDASEMDGIFKM